MAAPNTMVSAADAGRGFARGNANAATIANPAHPANCFMWVLLLSRRGYSTFRSGRARAFRVDVWDWEAGAQEPLQTPRQGGIDPTHRGELGFESAWCPQLELGSSP